MVFDGPEDYHRRIDDPALKIDDKTILFMRGVGAIGYPGSAEVVNMRPPAALIKKGIDSLPCIGDGRQSGTSGSPSILNASPEAAADGGLALLKTGDRVRIDLHKGTADILISKAELAKRRAAFVGNGGYPYPESQTPWQEIQRGIVDQLAEGMVLKPAVKFQRVAPDRRQPAPQPLTQSCPATADKRRTFRDAARVRMLCDPQSVGRRQRALPAASRLQGDRLDQRRLCLRAGPPGRRRAA